MQNIPVPAPISNANYGQSAKKTGNVSGVLAIQCLFAFVISVSDWKKNFTFRSNRGNKLDGCKLAIH